MKCGGRFRIRQLRPGRGMEWKRRNRNELDAVLTLSLSLSVPYRRRTPRCVVPPSYRGRLQKEVKSQARPPAQVSVISIEPRDTPLVVEFVGQTQGSHQVEIRARVNGFLDKRTYTEGSTVRAGQTMFRMDPKPYFKLSSMRPGARWSSSRPVSGLRGPTSLG